MADSNISNMNIVSNTSTIKSWIVIAEHFQTLSFASYDLLDVWN